MAVDRTKVLETAQKFLAKGQLDKAIAEFQKIIREDPQDVRTLLKIGDIQVRKQTAQSTREAIETYGRVAEQYAKQGFFLKAVAVYKQILKLDPNLVDYSLQLADMYEQLALVSDALTTYEQVAAVYAKTGETEKALSTMAKMVELDPENIPVRIKFAEALSKANRTEEAAEAFSAGGQLLKDQGRIDDYLKVAERLLFHRPDDIPLAREIAELYLERDDAKRALTKLQVCFKADPRDIATLELLAKAFGVLGQTPKTISVYREIARIHHESGRSEERAGFLKRILELDPNDAEARQTLAGYAQPSSSQVVPPPSAVIDSRGSGARAAPAGAGPARPPAGAGPVLPAGAARRAHPPPAAQPQPKDPDQSTEIYIEDDSEVSLEEGSDVSLQPEPDSAPAAPVPQPAPQPRAPAAAAPVAQPRMPAGAARAPAAPLAPPAAAAPAPRPAAAAAAPAPAPKAPLAPQKPAPRPASIPPEVAKEAQIARLLTECDVFMRYGLRSKVIDQLRRILDLEPHHVDARDRLKEILIETGDVAGAIAELVVLADLFAADNPDASMLYLRRAQELDAEHPDVVARLGAIDGGPSADVTTSELEAAPAGGDDDDVMFVDDESRASSAPKPPASEQPVPAAARRGDNEGEGSTVFDSSVATHAFVSEAEDEHSMTTVGVPLDEEENPSGVEAPLRDDGEPPAHAAASAAPIAPSNTSPGITTTARRSIAPNQRQSMRPPGSTFDIEEVLEEADFFVTQGLYDEARATLGDALGGHPNHPLLSEKLQEVEEMAAQAAASLPPNEGNPDDSFVLAEKLAEELGPPPEPGEGGAGDMLDVEQVFAQFKKGVAEQIGLEDSDTHYDLGIAYKEMGLLDDAIHEFELSMSNPQRQCVAHTMIGLCHVERGAINDAISHFKKGLYCETRTDREELGLYFELGVAYELLHDAKEAIYYYQKVQKRDPTFRGVVEKIRQLSEPRSGAGPAPTGDEVDQAFDDLMGNVEKKKDELTIDPDIDP